jgi:hypothetical protein
VTEDRCQLSDLPVSQCACRIHGKPEPRPAPTGPHIVATYPGLCPRCDYTIEPGDRITRTDDGWQHTDCR